MSSSTPTSTAAEGFRVSSKEAKNMILLDLGRQFLGIDASVDELIQRHAAQIASNETYSSILPRMPDEPRVPTYLEGAPGQGKTAITKAAARQFCDIVGLNFVAEPSPDYVVKENDFIYMTVNLSGATNRSDFGGMMIRTAVDTDRHIQIRQKAAGAGAVALVGLSTRANAMRDLARSMDYQVSVDSTNFDVGATIECSRVEIKGDPKITLQISKKLVETLIAESRARGVGIIEVKSMEDLDDERIVIHSEETSDGFAITVAAPRVLDPEQEYASAVLPSVRFAKLNQARFGMVNFDDVANASAPVRNIVLEVAQSGRLSGVMNIGKAYVTLSGNMGAADNTNTASLQSDAELTRVRKLNVYDTKTDWAEYISEKYTDEIGSCHFASFVTLKGDQPGIFLPAPSQTGRGQRKPNSRALENAIAMVRPHFHAARVAKCSPLMYSKRIEMEVKNTAGAIAAEQYISHVQAMETTALPMAENLINEDKFDVDAFDNHANLARGVEEQDFLFRFGAALADTVVSYVSRFESAKPAYPDAAAALETAMTRAIRGLGAMRANNGVTAETYFLVQIENRLPNIPGLGLEKNGTRHGSPAMDSAIIAAFAKVGPNPWRGTFEAARDNFSKVIAGSHIGTVDPAKHVKVRGKPTPQSAPVPTPAVAATPKQASLKI